MLLSIIIPVYNEKNTILELLEKVENVQLPIEKEIIIVDDFSTDGTRDLLKNVKHKVVYHKENQGKGAAVVTGLGYANGDIILIQDADLEYNPEEYYRLIQPILSNETKITYGSRILGAKKYKYLLHFLGNLLLSITTNIFYKTKLTDIETGYKVFKKEVLSRINLKAKRFDFEPEITAKFLKKGYKIKEIPISFNPRSFEEGKKIKWTDGVKALYYLIKYRFLE